MRAQRDKEHKLCVCAESEVTPAQAMIPAPCVCNSWQQDMTHYSEKLEKAGTVDFKRHLTRKVGTRSRQCRAKVRGRFAFPGARKF